MPEEINRVLTDSIADYLFVTEQSGLDNLAAEGVPEDRVFLTGNVMIDTLLKHLDKARTLDVMGRFGAGKDTFGLVTLHRPSNVDNVSTLQGILDAMTAISQDYDLILPLHPRTAASIDRFGLRDKIENTARINTAEPLGYLEFLNLMSNARFVLTDSGGIQEETTILGVPCFTLRDNTERPVTITHGTNTLTGPEPARILEAFSQLDSEPHSDSRPPLWDGNAAVRIIDTLAEKLQ
jgi:UDP-N-acetylglucosamine 2-epimerase (non-hydrolysing)